MAKAIIWPNGGQKIREKSNFFEKSDFISFELSLHIEYQKEVVCIYLSILFIINGKITSKARWQRQKCGQMKDKKAQ